MVRLPLRWQNRPRAAVDLGARSRPIREAIPSCDFAVTDSRSAHGAQRSTYVILHIEVPRPCACKRQFVLSLYLWCNYG